MSKRKSSKEKPDKPALIGPNRPADPKFLVKNASKVTVSLDGVDAGSVPRHDKGIVLDDGGGAGSVPGMLGELAPALVKEGERVARVYRTQDALDLMLRNGTINDDEFNAGRTFQRFFDIAGRYHVTAVNFDGSGGRMSREDFLTHQINARQMVDLLVDEMGGRERNGAAIAVENIIGKQVTFDQMFQCTGISKHFWRGCVVSGLRILVKFFDKRNKNKNLNG